MSAFAGIGRFRPAALALALALALAAVAVPGLAGCEDIRRFEGQWAGPVSADPAHQQGFPAQSLLRANVISASRRTISMTLDLPDRAGALPFLPISRAIDDALGDLRLDGEPLRSYLGYVREPGVEPYLVVASLFAEDRIDVRVIRGPDEIYGVFSLRRVRESTPLGTEPQR